MSAISLNKAKQQIAEFINNNLSSTQNYRIVTNTGGLFRFQIVLQRIEFNKLEKFMKEFPRLAERYFVYELESFEKMADNPGEGQLYRYTIVLRMWTFTKDGEGFNDD